MTQSIQTSVDRTVSEITTNQRHAIEELVGGDLAPDQRIFVLAYRPGIEPSEAVKSAARSLIDELLTKAHGNANQQDLVPGEIEAAIDEAIQSANE
ncbi:MAG: hypothetical protein NTV29_00055 [Planctomycetota bacterium]|nr:hypothetical protein [Planctomycetota bacterium]